jgi:hypothetical protein
VAQVLRVACTVTRRPPAWLSLSSDRAQAPAANLWP